jgi:hypothetical protein
VARNGSQRWAASPEPLRLQEAVLQLTCVLLKLPPLPAPNCGERWQINTHKEEFSRLGFDLCGPKFKQNRLLYIGLLVPCHRGYRVLLDLSWKDLEIVESRMKLKRGRSVGTISVLHWSLSRSLGMLGHEAKVGWCWVGAGLHTGKGRVGRAGLARRKFENSAHGWYKE